jgi:altronate hydrolase
MNKLLRLHPDDDMLIALADLAAGESCSCDGDTIQLTTPVTAKHKVSVREFSEGDVLRLYGVPVGKATRPIHRGEAIGTHNLRHHAAAVNVERHEPYVWTPPDVAAWRDRTFSGVVRGDGRVGTANYWLIFPLVFCENQSVEYLRNALEEPLGYRTSAFGDLTRDLLGQESGAPAHHPARMFSNVDGIRIITHSGGCGGTRADARSLCRVLAAYADHPNVAGITVLSLGCQNAQVEMFREALAQRNPKFDKPCFIFERQSAGRTEDMLRQAIKATLEGLRTANEAERRPVPLSALKIGVKCGGSDGFSGISANPAFGLVSDMAVALGGSAILAEFPELCGVESSLIARCVHDGDGRRFFDLMREFEAKARAAGTSFSDNPSPGNIRDGLITDAMKSAGAAKKGGTSPVVAVLDYAEQTAQPGLELLCTPGGDVEAVTGLVASGANVVLFSTGLGTPTGNPIVPVLKVSTNSTIAGKLDDIIDYDCGPVLSGTPLQASADGLFELVVQTAGGQYQSKADRLRQFDFQFWKRDISL